MDNRPIGFFDSGLGGLTSIPVLKEALPNEKVLYFGDTARTPYGSKQPDTIRRFARQITDYLVSKDVKMIVIACNTVTAMALDLLREEHPDLPILGVIEPTARRAGCSADITAMKKKPPRPGMTVIIIPATQPGKTRTAITGMSAASMI